MYYISCYWSRNGKNEVGSGQFVYFHLNALLKKDPEFKTRFLEEAKKELGGLGVSAEHIENFFQYSDASPGLSFTLRHERQYSKEIRVPFYEKADQFALDKIKQWLGHS
jgi:hypothetical protein